MHLKLNINVLKIILAAGLMLTFLRMPFGYYDFIRAIAFVIFGILIFFEFRKKDVFLILFVIGMILFNPFLKFYFGRTLWHIVDMSYAVILIVSIFKNKS